MGFMRSGRRRAPLRRRIVRLTAAVVFFVLSGVTAMGSADAAALPQATIKLSSVRAFVRSLLADTVALPRQASGTAAGTAAGKGGEVSAALTRAGHGSGRAPGRGAGELPAFSPAAHKTATGKSGAAHMGFDAKHSVRKCTQVQCVLRLV